MPLTSVSTTEALTETGAEDKVGVVSAFDDVDEDSDGAVVEVREALVSFIMNPV